MVLVMLSAALLLTTRSTSSLRSPQQPPAVTTATTVSDASYYRSIRPLHEDRERAYRRHGVQATCTLTVPARPTSAAGLATPYLLNDGTADCHQNNDDTAAFVEATIVHSDGTLAVYRPLVSDAGKPAAVRPTPPALRAGDVVTIHVGFQGDTLLLVGPGAASCVNGLGTSLFGQFAYCNAPAFFAAASARRTTFPPLATAADGLPCPTVRDFSVVDQDQSDNVSTSYLLLPDGQTAQDTAANRAALPTAAVLVNASDNGLINRKINPVLGCVNPTAPDLTDAVHPQVPSLALNELQARLQGPPVAVIPLNDPMAKVGDNQSYAKTALYRLGVGQPLAASADPVRYCRSLQQIAPPRLQRDKVFFQASTSPTPGQNLYDFMKARYQASLINLGCR
jgi:hypothetical protein